MAKRGKRIITATVMILLTIGLGFLLFQRGENYDGLACEEQAKSERFQVAIGSENVKLGIEELEALSKEMPNDQLVKINLAYKRWDGIQAKLDEIIRIAKSGRGLESPVIQAELEIMKALVESTESEVQTLINNPDLNDKLKSKAYNLMGCIKVYKTLFVKGTDQKKIQARIAGLMDEAVVNFKNSIKTVEANKKLFEGNESDIPRKNLELLLQKQKQSGSGEGKPQEGEGEKKEKKKGQMLIPFGAGPGDSGGEK